ncbi:NAD(P)/FAD-dependent oxidoreductase [Sphingomicrobium astaxanthinifaciens]|uniref:NAD(P)/FAD-dependent oxidoreductase n=1 Tax=Sphingomicrobium astaxanthinifaciens TaxID=1227949 RepID=UPI001FCC97E1|nr:NAD(P)/FAD-dependent oxidoreductase [Sphingomicrobium astaxanthinifaciens]MCJ7421213.1 NAD(P)/FAD-dependent oxidoreductase [Sphingomicrobium astaxanthinifaciens]
MERVDVIVMGAGAAGLMAATVAGQRGRRVLLVDHNGAPGKKILISGGGRCNFTNLSASDPNYLSQNPHFAKSALRRYTPADFIALIEKHGIAWHEKTLGQLFCDGSAKQIVAMLMDECRAAGVDFAFGEAAQVARNGEEFAASIGQRKVISNSLVLATGGLSIPKLGATSFAYDLARQWGLKIVEPRPALVPLTLAGDQLLFRELAGVAALVEARASKGPPFREAALFTHRGLSGPAILQVSSYWRNGEGVRIDFLPAERDGWLREAKRQTPNRQVGTLLAERLPERLAGTLADKLGLAGPLQAQSDKALAQAEERLGGWDFLPSGSEGFAKAEVTVGGISTAELSSKTMEAKKVPGLFCIGEAVDVTGWLGGYNFHWAWASGVAAGQAA